MIDAAPPHSVDAEQGVLGSMLISPRETVAECVEKINEEYFYVPAHQTIYSVLVDLWNAGEAIDLITYTQALRDRKLLESVGGAAFVTSLFNFVPTAANVEYYINIVREKYGLRSVIRVATEMARRGNNGSDTAEITAFAEEEFLKLRRVHGINAKGEQRATNWPATIDAATVRSSELAALTLDKRRPLLGDWLCEGDYGIIFAPRGVGKTWLGLLIAKAVSTGGRVGEWEAPGPAKVLYIDGEMPADLMRDRDKGLGSGEVEFLNHQILFDRTEKVLNITDHAVQEAILAKCIRDNIRLVVLDNLSTLASGVKENDSFEWERLHNWLLQFRRHKIAVILIHHAGRSGEIRGTSKREDAAFWVIALDDAKNQADDKRGARFISRFVKPSRNTQDEILPLEWHIATDMPTGEVSAGCKVAQTMDVFRQLIEEGVTECNHLAEEMRVSPGTISKWAKKATKAGWLRKKGREYQIVEGSPDGNGENERETK